VITYKKNEGCPDDKRDEDQQVSNSEDSKGRLLQTFISAQDSKPGTGPEHEDLLPSPQGKPKPKQDNEPHKVNEELRPENVSLSVDQIEREGQLRIIMAAKIGLGKSYDGPHSEGSRC
jgi:hypothetical protein